MKGNHRKTMTTLEEANVATTHKVLELGVEIFLDGEPRVRNCLVEVRVEVADHLHQCLCQCLHQGLHCTTDQPDKHPCQLTITNSHGPLCCTK